MVINTSNGRGKHIRAFVSVLLMCLLSLLACLQPFFYCLPMAANSFSSSFWYYFSSWEGRGVVPAPAITDVNHLGWLIALMCGFLIL